MHIDVSRFDAAVFDLEAALTGGAGQLLDALHEAGLRIALTSTSHDAFASIEAAGIDDRFDAIVDGARAVSPGLAGKPAPDALLQAAADLGVAPKRAVAIVADESGAEAASLGGFGLIVSDLAAIELRGVAAPFPARRLPHAVDALDALLSRARSRRPAVFLDYDGTLTPIVERPELATLAPAMREAIERLATETIVGIVSGRDLADVRGMTGIPDLLYAGSHGFQLRGADGHEEVVEEALPYRDDLAAAADEVEAALHEIAGALVERKGFAVAAHHRLVAEHEQTLAIERVRDIASRHPRLRVTGGKMVTELRPALPWDKGRAVRMLVDRLGGRDLFPVYIGDDETDEDAFRALRGRGAGIVAGDVPATDARYRLDSVDDVERWLEALRLHLERARR